MALLHREMRHLQDLVHPNIVRVFDCDRDGDTVFMTMEFLAGTTLTRKVRAPGFAGVDATEALPIIRSIAAALEFAHAKRVVHGDLTPGNVMLATSGVVKVIDFGIARIIADPVKTFMGRASARADAVTGVTPAYASPQMIENRGAGSARRRVLARVHRLGASDRLASVQSQAVDARARCRRQARTPSRV